APLCGCARQRTVAGKLPCPARGGAVSRRPRSHHQARQRVGVSRRARQPGDALCLDDAQHQRPRSRPADRAHGLAEAGLREHLRLRTTTLRFRQGAVFVPKGNGKTTVSAPLALHMTFGEGEGGAEGYAAAVTRDQARILFDTAKHMVSRSAEMKREWGVGALTNSIFQEETASNFVPISSDAKALDGLNVQCAVCDEIGSHRTSEVYDALITAMGKRRQPFLLSISTATGNTSGIGKQLWDYGLRVLQQSHVDDRVLAIM